MEGRGWVPLGRIRIPQITGRQYIFLGVLIMYGMESRHVSDRHSM